MLMPWLITPLVWFRMVKLFGFLLWTRATAAATEQQLGMWKLAAVDSWWGCFLLFPPCSSQSTTLHHGARESSGLYSHCYGPWHSLNGREKKSTDTTGRQAGWGKEALRGPTKKGPHHLRKDKDSTCWPCKIHRYIKASVYYRLCLLEVHRER